MLVLRLNHWQAGYNVHHKFYFGKMNVEKLIAAAKTWQFVGPQHTFTTVQQTPHAKLPSKNGKDAVLGTVTVTEADTSIDQLEHVQLTVSMVTGYRGAIVVELICPSGTPSTLLTARSRDSFKGEINWTFMTTRCWDERLV